MGGKTETECPEEKRNDTPYLKLYFCFNRILCFPFTDVLLLRNQLKTCDKGCSPNFLMMLMFAYVSIELLNWKADQHQPALHIKKTLVRLQIRSILIVPYV